MITNWTRHTSVSQINIFDCYYTPTERLARSLRKPSVENTSVISSSTDAKQALPAPPLWLHRLKHVDAELRVAHANLLQCLVLVTTLCNVLLVKNVVARRLRLQLRRREISAQWLSHNHQHSTVTAVCCSPSHHSLTDSQLGPVFPQQINLPLI